MATGGTSYIINKHMRCFSILLYLTKRYQPYFEPLFLVFVGRESHAC